MSTVASPRVEPPREGAKITIRDGKLIVPENPIIPFIEGDGTGADIWKASVRVLDGAVTKSYGHSKKIQWCEVYAGDKGAKYYDGNYFPQETLEAIKEFVVAIKGPLSTPVGGGMRSLNV